MDSRAIEKLRHKFIHIAMLSLFAVMLFIGLAINVAAFLIDYHSIHSSLDYLVETQGELSEHDIEENDNLSKDLNPFIVFSSEIHNADHFYIGVYKNGVREDYISDTSKAAVSYRIRSYMDTLIKNDPGYGRDGVYYYKIVHQSKSTIIIVMMNCASDINNRMRLLYVSLLIGCIGLLITYFLVRHFSERAVQPEIENSRRQQQFITNASHELKTPLAVIRANTELQEIMMGENEWTQSTLKQVDRMNGLIQNLVMIARTHEQEDKSSMASVDITKAVNESIDPFVALAKQDQKMLIREVQSNVTLVIDESKIRQLTALLLDNALKYCDEKGQVQVSLHTIKKNGIELVVSNSYREGENVDYAKFFDRFYRQDTSHNIDKGGYGIGLSIAESICQQYNGTIKADWKNGMISFICDLY